MAAITKITVSAGLGVLAVLVPVLALASGDAHQDDHAGSGWLTLGLTAVNFTIFCVLMRRFAGAPLRDFLSSRRTELAEAIEQATLAKAEAEQLKQQYEAESAKLEETRQGLIDEVRQLAEADRKRALEAANETAERMRQDAELRAQSELARAKKDLRAEAARLAAELAGQQIEARLNDAERKRLVEDFLGKVGSA